MIARVHFPHSRPRCRAAASVRLIAAMVTALVLWPAAAHAHLKLQSAQPAANDTVAAVPTELRLTFTQPVTLAFSQLTLIGPKGSEVALGDLATARGAPEVLLAPISGPLSAGVYTVRWQTAAGDAHPIRGEFAFTVTPGAAGLPAQAVRAPTVVPFDGTPAGPAAAIERAPPAEFGAESPLYAAVRWLTFLGLLGVIGAVAFRAAVLALAGRGADAETTALLQRMARRAATGGLWAALLLVVALALRLYAQWVALNGTGAAFDAAGLGVLLGGTVWGWGWWLQAVGTVLALAGLWFASRGAAGATAWSTAAVGAVLLAFTPALSGHAAAAGSFAVMLDGLHVLGAGGWLGSLLFVVAAGMPLALRQRSGERGILVARLINAFSPTALVFAALVVGTGSFSAWLHMGGVSPLWQTGYGRTLLLKLGVLSVVFATGAYNWLRVKPALGTEQAALHLRRSAALELTAGVIVLAVTAVLVATPPPAEMQMAGTVPEQVVRPPQ